MPRPLIERFQSDESWPQCYRTRQHPDLPFKRDCQECSLNGVNHNPPELAVGPAGPDDLTKTKLIVLSDHPGTYESELGFPMVDNRRISTQKPPPRNAGSMLRFLLSDMFGLDTYHDVLWENALRCQRKENEITSSQLRKCFMCWLSKDFKILDRIIPEVPLLIAGKHAFRALSLIDPERWSQAKGGLHNHRRSIHRASNRPVVVTINPAPVGRSIPRIETSFSGSCPQDIFSFPLLLGTAEWHMRRDLEYLRTFLAA